MATEKFKSFETDGTTQKMMPLLITDQVMAKPVQQPGGVAMLLSSTPDGETGHGTVIAGETKVGKSIQ